VFKLVLNVSIACFRGSESKSGTRRGENLPSLPPLLVMGPGIWVPDIFALLSLDLPLVLFYCTDYCMSAALSGKTTITLVSK